MGKPLGAPADELDPERQYPCAKVTPYPVNIGKIGEVKLSVRSQDKDAAEELIKARNSVDSMNDNEQSHQ